jgi:hypothetical protein
VPLFRTSVFLRSRNVQAMFQRNLVTSEDLVREMVMLRQGKSRQVKLLLASQNIIYIQPNPFLNPYFYSMPSHKPHPLIPSFNPIPRQVKCFANHTSWIVSIQSSVSSSIHVWVRDALALMTPHPRQIRPQNTACRAASTPSPRASYLHPVSSYPSPACR